MSKAEEDVVNTLRWLGLQWEENPNQSGRKPNKVLPSSSYEGLQNYQQYV